MGSGGNPREDVSETVKDETELAEERVRREFSDPNRDRLDRVLSEHDNEFSDRVRVVNEGLDQLGWSLDGIDAGRLFDNVESRERGDIDTTSAHASEVVTFARSTARHLSDGEYVEAIHSATGVIANTGGMLLSGVAEDAACKTGCHSPSPSPSPSPDLFDRMMEMDPY
jgi:hypothetical protein